MSMNIAIISNIERGSSVDGPGIRDVVFLKGCPLDRIWCHNPENILRVPQIMRNMRRYVNCGHCFGIEPEIATSECSEGAAGIIGENITTAEFLEIVKRESPYYK